MGKPEAGALAWGLFRGASRAAAAVFREKGRGIMTQSGREPPRLGPKVRALRRRESLSQVQLAERLGISPSYLNLIESNRRPLPATVLIKLAQLFGIDLHAFGADDDARLVSDLLEVF